MAAQATEVPERDRADAPDACPVCGASRSTPARSTPAVATRRCRTCRHRIAFHAPPAESTTRTDYHEQYDGDAFLASLESTRVRQARLITAGIRRQLGDADDLLDLGAGRGWLLEEARRAGFRRCAGLDTSLAAVAGLREAGFESLALCEDVSWVDAVGRLSFRPRIVALLDVIEHLPHAELVYQLEQLLEALRPELELIVLKVPLADGLFFRATNVLAALGVPQPFEQLYQVGTMPPHHHFFCKRSMQTFLDRIGLDAVEVLRDRDFEPASLVGRLWSRRKLPRWAGTFVGWSAAATIRTFGLEDAGVFFARPR